MVCLQRSGQAQPPLGRRSSFSFWSRFFGFCSSASWGWGESFGRPICEPDDAKHWLSPFQRTTQGGWKKDFDTFYLELLIILCHLLIAIVVPLSTLFQRGGDRGGQRDRTGTGDLQGFTGVAVGSLRSAWWFTALSVGAVVIYVGQALAAFKLDTVGRRRGRKSLERGRARRRARPIRAHV